MSDDEFDEPALKRSRRVNRACDICRRKKTKCDGPSKTSHNCSSCVAYGYTCTYVEAAKKRGPPKGYIDNMEARIQKIERLLQTLVPDADLAQTTSWKSPPPAEDDDRIHLSLTENLQRLSLSPHPDNVFFGRSSGAMLLQTAINVKQDVEPQNARLHKEFWASRPSPELPRQPTYTFPPPDLAVSLVELFFAHINLIVPVLHRPTFERDLSSGLHLTNDGFAGTYLLVCALGSRYSEDPRVLLDGTTKLHSCGWRWFEQIQLVREPLGPPVSIYDLQSISLAVMFIHGTTAPHASWTYLSFGIRIAQDVGAHRQKDAGHHWTAEDELWKRAFWALMYFDRLTSSYYGRPSAMQDEDMDLEYPIPCDDQYWDQGFKQPEGKPSMISAFVCLLQLSQVTSFSLRTLYSINKQKVLFGLTTGTKSDWEQRIVVELDTTLDKWLEDIPPHLKWNPQREFSVFETQSVALHLSYYYLKMLVHRPYVPPPDKVSTKVNSPSLAICLHAARSCVQILEHYQKQTGGKPMPLMQSAMFSSALFLLLNLWANKRNGSGSVLDATKDMAGVDSCLQGLHECEKRWHSAGRLCDILHNLRRGLTMPELPKPTNKRERGAEQPKNAIFEIREAAPELRPIKRPIVEIPGPRRLQTSDVPAITTQFLPHNTPPLSSSSSSFHGQSHDRYISRNDEQAYLETPLSATSHRSDVYVPRMPPREAYSSNSPAFRDPHYNSPETPLSSASSLPPPSSQRLNYSHVRDYRRETHNHWYDGQQSPVVQGPPANSHRSSASSHHLISSNGLAPFFPVSEAFYDHVTSSFSGHRRIQDDYSSGYSSGEVGYYQDHAGHGRESDYSSRETTWSSISASYHGSDWGPYYNNLSQSRMH
ncbi:Fungal-trans domain-containing protein [Mycena indigotica]|uniref:Fungal-trans domain-containing protein n=1 Tax=Mycena indigotica TaxID=2126181 RepID=A0A8H6T157_9AGAR|nr:Fungal-trans domain-containing protein [Mycena indigotica]KAF7309763.1 Fungal-trans domain-containing protein [Mycena indigotica]